MTFHHLKDESYYNELYDRFTIERCRRWQKAYQANLEDTNWRLMSDGISYRLGALSGRLKGVEGEENLKELARLKNET